MSNDLPHTRGRSIIKLPSGRILYDSAKDSFEITNTIYSGNGKRVIREDKEEVSK
jgi:hypothetical protein